METPILPISQNFGTSNFNTAVSNWGAKADYCGTIEIAVITKSNNINKPDSFTLYSSSGFGNGQVSALNNGC